MLRPLGRVGLLPERVTGDGGRHQTDGERARGHAWEFAGGQQQPAADLDGTVDPDEGLGIGGHLCRCLVRQLVHGLVHEVTRHVGAVCGIPEGVDARVDEDRGEHGTGDTAEDHSVTTFGGWVLC